MTWLDQLRTRFRGLGVIVPKGRKPIENCVVNLSGFPGDPLILDVDKLISNDAFARQIVYQYEQPCDLIVFHAKLETPSVTLIEAKGTRNEAYGDEYKAVDQLSSSSSVLDRAIDDCSIALPQFHVTGAVVTGSSNSGAMLSTDLAIYAAKADIDVVVVTSGWDVHLQMFGR
ncbi:MAG: hypothetical protein OXC83_08800 [Chloroflexi bacterium]|nr:hypothetical protein [Chloroflexota bacterium]